LPRSRLKEFGYKSLRSPIGMLPLFQLTHRKIVLSLIYRCYCDSREWYPEE